MTNPPDARSVSARLRRGAYYLGPLLLWMGVIFYLSTDNGSSEHTRPVVGGMLGQILQRLGLSLTPDILEWINWHLRKAAHVTEYAILAILAFRAVAYGNPHFRSRNIVLPLLIGLLYAVSDEYHQSFVPSRGPSPDDVFVDFAGVLVGVLICLWRHCLRSTASPAPRKRQEKR